ncbi:hypothetical protein LTR85_009653 [Meristemomyces frigidus]|nr:hypothetical protein LTR85_009653 [Meristemomyces frigidus]
MGAVLAIIVAADALWDLIISSTVGVAIATAPTWLLLMVLPVRLTMHDHHHKAFLDPGPGPADVDWYNKQDPLVPKIYVRIPESSGASMNAINGKSLFLKDWNKETGVAHACWDYDPQTCSILQDFRTHCYDWTNTTVSNDIPKYMVNGTYTPHGDVDFHVKVGEIHYFPPCAQWAAPIAADCRYWDESWKQKNNTNTSIEIPDIGHTGLETPDGFQAPTNSTPNLLGKKIHITSPRSLDDQQTARLEDFFLSIPHRSATDDIEVFAKQGAMVLRDHLRSGISDGTFLALHRATTALLRTDDAHNKLWKRAVPFVKVPADADHLVEALMKHVVDQAHNDDKMRMEAFATNAMMEAVTRRVVDNGKARRVDVRLINRAWDKIDHKGGGCYRFID